MDRSRATAAACRASAGSWSTRALWCPRRRGRSAGIAGIRHQARGLDTRNGTELVVDGGIAADADGPYDLAARGADEHAARHRHHAAVRQFRQHRVKERRLLRAPLELASAEAHAEGAPGLGRRDLWPE